MGFQSFDLYHGNMSIPVTPGLLLVLDGLQCPDQPLSRGRSRDPRTEGLLTKVTFKGLGLPEPLSTDVLLLTPSLKGGRPVVPPPLPTNDSERVSKTSIVVTSDTIRTPFPVGTPSRGPGGLVLLFLFPLTGPMFQCT